MPILSVEDVEMDTAEDMSIELAIEGVDGKRVPVEKNGWWKGLPVACCKGAAMSCFNPRYFELKYGWKQQLLDWKGRSVWRLLAVDGSEICRAYVALDGLVYVSLGELLDQVAAAVEVVCELPVNVLGAAKPVSRRTESEWKNVARRRKARVKREFRGNKSARVYTAPFSELEVMTGEEQMRKVRTGVRED